MGNNVELSSAYNQNDCSIICKQYLPVGAAVGLGVAAFGFGVGVGFLVGFLWKIKWKKEMT
jgi:hypothetical protein